MGNRSRALPRPRAQRRRPVALDGRALSGTTGIVLDPIVSLRQRIRLPPGAHRPALFRHRHGVRSRDGRGARPEVPRPGRHGPHLRAGDDPRAERRCATSASPPTTRVLFERLASRVLGTDGSLRASAATGRGERARPARPVAARASPAICRSCSCAWRRRRPAAGAPGAAGAGVLAPQGPERRRRDPQRASGRATSTKCRRSSPAVLDDGPWSTWQHRPGGAYLLRADRMGRAERVLLEAVARAMLRGDAATCAPQLDRPDAGSSRPSRRSCRPPPAPPPSAPARCRRAGA